MGLDLESQFNSLILPLIILELVTSANNDEIFGMDYNRVSMECSKFYRQSKVGNMVVQFIFKLHLNK
jgi:hypothetical protein